jgi:16S rRNA (adenine1518-N6/adenine1519-N6)-dimethyltransferase
MHNDQISSGSKENQTRSYLMQLFDEVGFSPTSRHGQNFLIDLNIMRLLERSAMLEPRDLILEVGCGTGALTSMVAPQVGAVVAVDIDEILFQLALESLDHFGNVTLLHQDALRNKNHFDDRLIDAVQQKLAEHPDRRFKLVANLPYSIATPVISNLLAWPTPPASMTVTIQKELADRIAARPRTKDYSSLSIWVQSQCRVELVRILPPSVFWPRPKVHSAIIRLELDETRRAAIPDLAYFHDFVRSLFFHRRKFLRSVLLSTYKGRLDKPRVDEIRDAMQLGPTARAEELEIDTILQLCERCRAAVPDWSL